MSQDKAQAAGNGKFLSKDCNAILAHLRASLRARLEGGSPVLRSLELATASPALARLVEQPVQTR